MERRFARGFERFRANLHKRLDLRVEAGTVGTDGLLPHFGKEEWIVPGALRTGGTTSCRWQQGFVLRVKRRVRDIEQNFSLYPFSKRPDGDGFGLLVLEDCRGCSMLRKAFRKGAALVVWLESCDFKGVRDGQLPEVESLLDFLDK